MEMGGQLHVPAALPTRYKPGTIWKLGWPSEPVSTFRRREKSLPPAGIRTPDSPIRSPVTINSRRECDIYMFLLFLFSFPLISLSLLFVPCFVIFYPRLFTFPPYVFFYIPFFFLLLAKLHVFLVLCCVIFVWFWIPNSTLVSETN
jgi:hypothetical protein